MLRRAIVLNLLGQVGSLLLGFAGSVLVARWLGAADRGLYGIMLSVVDIVLGLTAVGMPAAVLYYGSKREPPTAGLLGNTLLYAGALAVIMVPGFWLLREPLSTAFGHGRGGAVWVLVGMVVPLTFLDWTLRSQLVGRLRYGLVSLLAIVGRFATLLVAVLLVGLAHLGVSGALLSAAATLLTTVVVALPILLRHGRPRPDVGLFRSMASYGSRVQIGTLFQILNYRFDVVVVQIFQPLSSVGYYVIAEMTAELVLTLSRAFQTAVLPLVTRVEGGEREAQTKQALHHHTILALGAIAANLVIGPLIIIYAYGPSFHRGLVPMLIMLPSMWFLGTGIVVSSDLGGRGRPGSSSALAGLAVIGTIVFDFALIPWLGVIGAAVASVIAYTTYGMASLVVLGRIANLSLRELVVPTRDELRTYPRVARGLLDPRSRAAAGDAATPEPPMTGRGPVDPPE